MEKCNYLLSGIAGNTVITVVTAFLLVFSSSVYAFSPPEETFASRLVGAAIERTSHRVRYDGSYRKIGYPGGDVPPDIGVCTDLIVRVYRKVGIDLQELVHRDMSGAFDQYPGRWGLHSPDPNIDHRRVLNLDCFFRRHGKVLPASRNPEDYRPGDVVVWRLPGGLPHIGMVVNVPADGGERLMVVHNIGAGPRMEDVLFRYQITGHYRYGGPEQ